MAALTLDRNPCVLLVETDEVLAGHLSMDLKSSGYEPIVASNLATGQHLAHELQPALIVIDRMLGGESRDCPYVLTSEVWGVECPSCC